MASAEARFSHTTAICPLRRRRGKSGPWRRGGEAQHVHLLLSSCLEHARRVAPWVRALFRKESEVSRNHLSRTPAAARDMDSAGRRDWRSDLFAMRVRMRCVIAYSDTVFNRVVIQPLSAFAAFMLTFRSALSALR